MNIEEAREYALSLPLAEESLFAEDWVQYKVCGKWFMLIWLNAPEQRVAVKCDPDLLFVTHEHSDHYDLSAIREVSKDGTLFVSNGKVAELSGMSDPMKVDEVHLSVWLIHASFLLHRPLRLADFNTRTYPFHSLS